MNVAAESNYPIVDEPLVQGDDIAIPVTIKVATVPEDITGWTWRAHVRRKPSGSLITQFTVDVIDPTQGEMVLRLSPAQSELLENGMVFDLEQMTPVVRTWWFATLRVREDISYG